MVLLYNEKNQENEKKIEKKYLPILKLIV